MSTDHSETAASVTIVALGVYSAQCKGPRCRNLGRLLLRYADADGRPISHSVLCHAHARLRVERDRVAGLKVYDDRGSRRDEIEDRAPGIAHDEWHEVEHRNQVLSIWLQSPPRIP